MGTALNTATKHSLTLTIFWTIQANGTDVPANGGKMLKGADGITVSKSANGEMTISGSGLGTMNSFNVKSLVILLLILKQQLKKITDGKTVEFSGGKTSL